MVSFTSTKKYLDSFINYERQNDYSYKKSLKLKRVKHLLESLSIPYTNLKVIHVAGTKGKGSTATFVSYILAASGFRVGLYTSPHFNNFRERIKIISSHGKRIKESLIPEEEVVRIVNKFKPLIDGLRSGAGIGKPTFFEIYTALALQFFLKKNVNYAVLETGLGGRLDATNVARPLISVITRIGYDHTQKLGKRLGDIAYEKAGIIKKGVPLTTIDQRESALRVILKKARLTGSESFVLKRDFNYCNVKLDRVTRFDFSFGSFKLKNLCISLKGMCQVENASLSVASICVLKEEGHILGRVDFRGGLREACLEGRFEVALKDPLVILDIAHNVPSFRALSENIKNYFPKKKIILIFAVSKDKDVKKMLSLIDYNKIVITSFDNPRVLPAHRVKEFCRIGAVIELSVGKALKKAQTYYNKDYLILISGSFFLVSEAKKALKRLKHGDKRL